MDANAEKRHFSTAFCTGFCGNCEKAVHKPFSPKCVIARRAKRGPRKSHSLLWGRGEAKTQLEFSAYAENGTLWLVLRRCGNPFPCGTMCRGMQSIAKDADCHVASSMLLAMTGDHGLPRSFAARNDMRFRLMRRKVDGLADRPGGRSLRYVPLGVVGAVIGRPRGRHIPLRICRRRNRDAVPPGD